MMSFNPRELYKARKKENIETFAPYIRYVAQSGLLLVIAFLGIVFVDQYIKLIRYTPAEFPLELVVTLVVGLFVLYSPYRTWLKPADIIYVMPKQAEMNHYFESCRRRGYIQSLIPLIIVAFLAHFLLKAYLGDDYEAVAIMQFVLLKIVTFYSLYNINELSNKTRVVSIKLLVALLVFIAVYASILGIDGFIVSIVCYVILAFVALYTMRQTRKFVNWQQMISEEQKKVHRTYRLLNMFVDIPNIQHSSKNRTYLARFAELISFKRNHTFAYLHYLTFARSEVGGIYVRNIIVGSIIGLVMAYTMLWGGYASLMFTIIFMGVNAVQLTTLRQIHRHSVWQNIYPILLGEQQKQMTSIELTLLCVSSFILALVPSVPMVLAGEWRLVSIFVIAVVAIILWRLTVIRQVIKKQLK